MMEPILEELAEEYADKFETVFIDIAQNEEAKEEYSVRVIPTQVFFDAEGNELFRHEGFFSKEDILAKWRELGIDLPEAD
jgi:thioredoxin 1